MTNTDTTTLFSLFHTEDEAREAISDLRDAGIPASHIQRAGGASDSSLASLQQLEVPASDMQMLSDGVRSGGTVIVVSTEEALADKAEEIFRRHRANKVDEKLVRDTGANASAAAKGTEVGGVIPIVEEELVVGKRAVQRGGIRLVSRVVSTPVEEKVTLQEEHAVVQRRAVNRENTPADVDAPRDQSFEVVNRGEEVVVSKTARVVEEVMVGKEATERTETVRNTVHKTEIEVEQIGPNESKKAPRKRS